jgi:hypothetical protein
MIGDAGSPVTTRDRKKLGCRSVPGAGSDLRCRSISLSWLANMAKSKETPPEPLSLQRYSGRILLIAA